MKKAVALLALLFVLLGTAMPSDAWVRGGWRGGWHGGCCWGGWWWPGAVVGGLALGAAVAATYPYPYYAAPPPVVYEPPVVYQQPSVNAAPPAQLVRREVVYPNGRYVLYGDGQSQPWRWVWVPAGPPAPSLPPPSGQ